MTSTLKITYPQSLANDPDIQLLQDLLSHHHNLREFRILFPLTSGFSDCRVFLGLAQFEVAATNPWIIKLGPSEEIAAEDKGYTLAKSFVPVRNIVNKLTKYTNGAKGLLIYDFAGFSGRAPLDLEAVVKRPESFEAVTRTVACIEQWATVSTLRSINLGDS